MTIKKIISGIMLSLLFIFSRPFSILAQDVTMTGASQNPADQRIMLQLFSAFDTLKHHSIRPAEGYLKHDYLIPAGFYKQMWDWDGFFIGCYLASHKKEDAKYLKGWVLNFVNGVDKDGYVAGCMTTKGPRPIFGKFAMKPFLSQGAWFASVYGGSYSWIAPVYEKLKKVLDYREKTQFDKKYGLFFWDIAIQSGADNNPALTNDTNDRSAILAAEYKYIPVKGVHQHDEDCRKAGETGGCENV